MQGGEYPKHWDIPLSRILKSLRSSAVAIDGALAEILCVEEAPPA